MQRRLRQFFLCLQIRSLHAARPRDRHIETLHVYNRDNVQLLRQAVESSPTSGLSLDLGGWKHGLEELSKPEQVDRNDWEDGLSMLSKIRADVKTYELVDDWIKVTGSRAVVNKLNFSKTYPFYMPPTELNKLAVVDIVPPPASLRNYPPRTLRQLPPNISAKCKKQTDWVECSKSWWDEADQSAISSGEVFTFKYVDGRGPRPYFEVWPRKPEICQPPGCPLVVFLHGAGEGVRPDYSREKKPFQILQMFANKLRCAASGSDPRCSILGQPMGSWMGDERLRKDQRVVFLAPQIHPDWDLEMFQQPGVIDSFVIPLVQHVLSKRKGTRMIDPQRVYITGLSDGGLGAIRAALRYPDIFAFALAFSVRTDHPDVFKDERTWMVADPSRSNRKLREVILVQGSKDPPKMDLLNVFLRLHNSTKFTYRIWPGNDHNTWLGGYIAARHALWFGCPLPWQRLVGSVATHPECFPEEISDRRKVNTLRLVVLLACIAVAFLVKESYNDLSGSRLPGSRRGTKRLRLPTWSSMFGGPSQKETKKEGTGNNAGKRSRAHGLPLSSIESQFSKTNETWATSKLVARGGNPMLPDVDVMVLLCQQARRTPWSAAVHTEFGHVWSYRQLMCRVVALEERLDSEAPIIQDGRHCGMLSSGGTESLLGLLGVLQARRCLVPLDPKHPDERLAFMIRDAQLMVAIVGSLSSGINHALGLGLRKVVTMEDLASPTWLPCKSARGIRNHQVRQWRTSDLASAAYMLYTSGSTGKPKAMLQLHRGVLSHALAAAEVLCPLPQDASLFHTPPLYGFHMCQLFPFLIVGAKVASPLPHCVRTPAQIWEGPVGSSGVTFAAFIPSILDPRLGGAGLHLPKTIRLLKCSGESLGGSTVLRVLDECVHGKRDVEVVNWWGNTECLGCTALRMSFRTARWISAGGDGLERTSGRCPPLSQALPLGMPIKWRTLHLMPFDCDFEMLGPGVGEACVSGMAVCPPYVNRPTEAAGAFTDSPFGPGKLLRTGDILLRQELPDRLQPYGLRFVGRKDFQLKVNGVRIEIGEIEAVAATCEGIDSCVVKLDTRRLENVVSKRLVAFYVGSQMSPAKVQAHIAAHLPNEMVPHQVVRLDNFPRNDANKIDRSALVPPAIDTNDLTEGGFPVVDSLGFQRILASREELWTHRMTEAMYSMAPFCFIISHWCPHDMKSATHETKLYILNFVGFIHHARILNITTLFIGLTDKTGSQAYGPWKSYAWITILYLAMGLPHALCIGFATFHRWTFLAILLYKKMIMLFDRVHIPIPVAVVKACLQVFGQREMQRHSESSENLCAIRWYPFWPGAQIALVACTAPLFGSVPITLFESVANSNHWLHVLVEDEYFGSPNGTVGSWMALFAHYLMGYHFGMQIVQAHRIVMEKLVNRGFAFVVGVRCMAAAAFGILAWVREIIDTPVLPEMERHTVPETMWDWPYYFDHFYPARFVAEWLAALLAMTALCEGVWAWNLVGRNLLFTFLAHMILTVDMPALLDALAQAGALAQIVVLGLVPYVYSMSVGSCGFEVAAQIAKAIQRLNKKLSSEISTKKG